MRSKRNEEVGEKSKRCEIRFWFAFYSRKIFEEYQFWTIKLE